MTHKLIELFDCIWDAIEAGPTNAKRPEVASRVVDDAQTALELPFEQFPALKYFEAALAAAEKGGLGRLATLLRQAGSSLVWSHNPSYTEENAGARFMQNYVLGQMAGLGAAFATDAPPSGFLLMGPDLFYPIHSHAPAEVYMVLTPGSLWQLDGQDWFSVAPGDIINHRPQQPHAMRTTTEPLLAYGAWLEAGDRGAITI